MEWYSNLYLSEKLVKKKEKIIRKIEKCAGTPGLYVITIASNPHNLLDIFSTDYLLQPILHGLCPMIIGIADSYDEAVDIAQTVILSSYKETGSFHVQNYLRSQLPNGTDFYYSYPMQQLTHRKRLFPRKK